MKKIFNLESFVFGVIILLPSYLLRFSIFGVPSNFLEVLIGLAFLCYLGKKNIFQKIKSSFDKKNWLLLSIIFLGLILSTLTNKSLLAGFGIIKGWFVFPIILALIAKNVLSKEKIYLAIYLSTTLVALISFVFYLQNMLTFDGRLQGLFNSPNYLAMYLAPAILIGVLELFLASAKKTTRHFWLHILSLGIILFVMYQTHSYASWVALIVIFLALGMFYGGKKNKIPILAGLVIFSALLVFFQWQNSKFQDFLSLSSRSSLSSRLMIWHSAEKILIDNWIFGIGPGNFQEKYLANQKNMPEPYLEWAVPHPHNLFLSFWLQAGFIGMIAFILLLWHWLRLVLQQEKSHWQLIALGIMFYFLLHGLVDTTYFKNDLAILFWLNFIAVL